MTSRDCYVYITLPGQTGFVTAGRFQHIRHPNRPAVGRFVYGASYLARPDALPIDPTELPLSDTTYETSLNRGVFGALQDATGGSWARRVRNAGLAEVSDDPLDYMIHAPDDRAGALAFGPGPKPIFPKQVFSTLDDLPELHTLLQEMLDEQDGPSSPNRYFSLGTSMGGARPKVLIQNQSNLCLAKFNLPDDPFNHVRMEHAMLKLAATCGISTASSEVIQINDEDVLLIDRYDRHLGAAGCTRPRLLSAMTLLQADESEPRRNRWSYVQLADRLAHLSGQPDNDGPELFRRMCFNVMIDNQRDNPRQHVLISDTQNEGWRLTPVQNLIPGCSGPKVRAQYPMELGDAGRLVSVENLLTQHGRFHLTAADARIVIDTMGLIISSTWRSICRAQGLSDSDCAAIAPTMATSLDELNQASAA